MNSLLYQTCSAFAALFVMLAWLRPISFRFLLDKDSVEPSLGRIGQFTALVVSTWAFMSMAASGQLNEWFFTGYMLVWAGAQAASLALKIKGDSPK